MPKDQSNCITTWLSFFSCHKLNVMASLIFWSKLSPQLSQRAFSSVEPHSHLQQSTSLLCLQITIETFFCSISLQIYDVVSGLISTYQIYYFAINYFNALFQNWGRNDQKFLKENLCTLDCFFFPSIKM